jgi:hypothetical protein
VKVCIVGMSGRLGRYRTAQALSRLRVSHLQVGDDRRVWTGHVADPAPASIRTHRVDFVLFIVDALGREELPHGPHAPSADLAGAPAR